MSFSDDLPRIVLIPGTGADARMFGRFLEEFPNAIVLEWIVPHSRESMVSYAKRLARKIPDGPFVLCGVSFGGSMALSIARHRPPRAVLLISALCDWGELPALLRILRNAPTVFFRAATALLVGGAKVLTALGVRKLIVRMIADSDRRFVAWALRQCLRARSEMPATVVVERIHGASDRLVRPPRSDRSIEWVPGAGHLMVMTHRCAVTDAIRRVLR